MLGAALGDSLGGVAALLLCALIPAAIAFHNIRYAAWTLLREGARRVVAEESHRRARPLVLAFVAGATAAGTALGALVVLFGPPGEPPGDVVLRVAFLVTGSALVAATLPATLYMGAVLRAGHRDPALRLSSTRSAIAGFAYVAAAPVVGFGAGPDAAAATLIAWGVLGPLLLGLLSAWLHNPLGRRREAGRGRDPAR